MPKRSRKKKPVAKKPPRPKKRQSKKSERDENQKAFDLVKYVEEMAVEPGGKNPLAVALGRLGGLKGGRVRADRLSKEQRRASAIKAARARWDKKAATRK